MDYDLSLILTVLIVIATLFAFVRKPYSHPVVSELIFYPVKSCEGIKVQSAEIRETGLRYDREWAVLDGKKELVNLKLDPRLMKVQTELETAGNGEATVLILKYEGKSVRVQLCESVGSPAFEVVMSLVPRLVRLESNNGVSAFFQSALGADYVLVRMVEARLPHDKYAGDFDGKVSLNAAQQIHVIAEESLQALRSALPGRMKDLALDAFRANIVVRGSRPYDEDTWGEFSISSVQMRCVKPCWRCPVPTINPSTLEFDKEQQPNATLRATHGLDNLAMFGLWCGRRNDGVIQVGDTVVIESRRPFSIK